MMKIENKKYMEMRVLDELFHAHRDRDISWNNKKYEKEMENYLRVMNQQFELASNREDPADPEMWMDHVIARYISCVLNRDKNESVDIYAKYFIPYPEKLEPELLEFLKE